MNFKNNTKHLCSFHLSALLALSVGPALLITPKWLPPVQASSADRDLWKDRKGISSFASLLIQQVTFVRLPPFLLIIRRSKPYPLTLPSLDLNLLYDPPLALEISSGLPQGAR
jgi:hypothetical protein